MTVVSDGFCTVFVPPRLPLHGCGLLVHPASSRAQLGECLGRELGETTGTGHTFRHAALIECGCNAHARRKFEDAETGFRKVAGEALAFWTALYAIEAEATRQALSADARFALRQARSAPIVADLRRWLDAHLGTFLPQDEITKALNYTNNHWDAPTRFLTDGRIPIDNNWAEHAVKAIALGRNAYMFAGSDAAGRRSATF